jgi:predicted ABC-class ATPase
MHIRTPLALDLVSIRAEDGRSVSEVDISAFVRDIPFGKDTRAFSTRNASGSTSQASAIMEVCGGCTHCPPPGSLARGVLGA